MSFADDDRFVVQQDILFEEIDDEIVMLDLDKNVYFGTNAMGKVIWEMLHGLSFGEIIDSLLSDYDVDRTTLAADVGEFLSGALGSGVIRLDRSDGPN
jgi:hypothetical protein